MSKIYKSQRELSVGYNNLPIISINKSQCERVVCEEYKLLENRLDKLEKVIRLYFITVLGIFYNDRFAKRENCFVCGGFVVYDFFCGILDISIEFVVTTLCGLCMCSVAEH